MTIIQSLALLLIIIVPVLVIIYGMSLSRKAETEMDKVFISRFFIILVITFIAGGIIRTIQQNTDIEWLNGFVPIFGGLYISLWGVPVFWRISNKKIGGIKVFFVFLLGLFLMLLGLSSIILGIIQVWNALI